MLVLIKMKLSSVRCRSSV